MKRDEFFFGKTCDLIHLSGRETKTSYVLDKDTQNTSH